ncbi:MAG: hypothetical protein ACYDAL_01000 [Candidatus Dormibacteraceae bacterium]
MVYVGSAPATGALDADRSAVEVVLPACEDVEADGGSLEGLTAEGGAGTGCGRSRSGGADRRHAARCAVHDRLHRFSSEHSKDAFQRGYAWVGGSAELRDITYVNLPMSHWPMWSSPREPAGIIGGVAKAARP